jgi:hypothetical protein
MSSGYINKAATTSSPAVVYEDFHGDGGVMDYYESIRTTRSTTSTSSSNQEQQRSSSVTRTSSLPPEGR